MVADKPKSVEGSGRFLDDSDSLRAIIGSLPPNLRAAYEALGALTLEAGFANRVFVSYKLASGEPTDIQQLVLGDLEVTRIGGPKVSVVCSVKGPVTIVVLPVQIREDLFLHVPQNFILRWKGKRNSAGVLQFMPHFALLIKSRSRPHLQVNGDTYCETLNDFKERFPRYPVRY